MKIAKIKKDEVNEVVEFLEHALKLARLGEIRAMVGAMRIRGGMTRKFEYGEPYTKEPAQSVGDLEMVKMWVYGSLHHFDGPSREDELKAVKDKVE